MKRQLAEKCNEGQLTPDERAEYEAYVQASTLIGILQAKPQLRSAFKQPPVLPLVSKAEGRMKRHFQKL